MMRKLLVYLIILFPLFPLYGSTKPWKINKDHSEILFKVSYLSVSEVSGRFQKFNGLAHFDPKYHMINKVDISIKTDSIFTANSMRDGHLKSKDFLDAKNHPEIIFKSDDITPIAPDLFRARGTLSIKGIKKDYSLDFSLSEEVEDTWGLKSRFVTFKGNIKRADFNINWNKSLTGSKLLIGENIEVQGKFQIQPLGKLTPSSKHMIPINKYLEYREKLMRGEITQKEFDKKTYRPMEIKKIERPNKSPEKMESAPVEKKNNTKWKIAYSIIWFLGLLASIIVYFQGKLFLMKFFSKEYDEEGRGGLLTSIILFPIFYLFSWCMWVLGKGQFIFD